MKAVQHVYTVLYWNQISAAVADELEALFDGKKFKRDSNLHDIQQFLNTNQWGIHFGLTRVMSHRLHGGEIKQNNNNNNNTVL